MTSIRQQLAADYARIQRAKYYIPEVFPIQATAVSSSSSVGGYTQPVYPSSTTTQVSQQFVGTHTLGDQPIYVSQNYRRALVRDARDKDLVTSVSTDIQANLSIIPREGFLQTKSFDTSASTFTGNSAALSNVDEVPAIKQLFQAANFIQTQAIAKSTTNTYNSFHNSISSEIQYYVNHTIKAAPRGDWEVLPLDSAEKIKLVFTILTTANEVRHKYVDYSNPAKRVKYSTIRGYRAALRHLHIVNNLESPIISVDPYLYSFFEGIKKSCSHSKKDKKPVNIDQVLRISCSALEDIKILRNQFTGCFKNLPAQKINIAASLAAVRRAAVVVCGFFGIRRNSETLHLKVSDFSDCKSHYIVNVTLAKNDQLSKGHKTVIPHILSTPGYSPYLIVKAWIIFRKAYVDHITPPVSHDFLFVNVDGAVRSRGNIISSDTLSKDIRKAITAVDPNILQGDILSLRAGGSRFYCNANPATRSLARFLGGWVTTPDQLDACYAPVQAEDIAHTVIATASKGVNLWILEAELLRITNHTFYENKVLIHDLSFTRVNLFIQSSNPSTTYNISPLLFDNAEALAKRDPRFSGLRDWWAKNKLF